MNYKTVFSYDVAQEFCQASTTRLRLLSTLLRAYLRKSWRRLLGTIFHDLVPFQVKKTAAAFYTSVLTAELLAWLSINNRDSKVADFVAGSGGLLVATYRRKRNLLEKEGKFSEADHRRFVENELLGVDVVPFAANVASATFPMAK